MTVVAQQKEWSTGTTISDQWTCQCVKGVSSMTGCWRYIHSVMQHAPTSSISWRSLEFSWACDSIVHVSTVISSFRKGCAPARESHRVDFRVAAKESQVAANWLTDLCLRTSLQHASTGVFTWTSAWLDACGERIEIRNNSNSTGDINSESWW